MRCLLIIVVGLLVAQLVVASDVVDLSDSNFDSLTGTGDWLVEFYAPWCGHCKKLAPIYEEVATKLKGNTNVGKVDCTVYKGLQERFGIRGFPTIKFIKDGKMYDYSDKRELDAFVAFVGGNYNKQDGKAVPTSPAAQVPVVEKEDSPKTTGSDVVVLTTENFDSKTSSGEWLLEFYAPWCGHCKNLAPTYEAVATSLKPRINVAKIDCTAEEALRARFNIKGYPTLKFLKEGRLYDYSGGRTGEQLIEFVTKGFSSATSEGIENFKADPNYKQRSEVKSVPKGPSDVVVLTDSNFDDKIAEGAWLVEFFAPWCGHCKNLAPTYEKVATALKGDTHVAKVDCTTEKGVCSRMGIRGFPTIQLFRDGLKYEYSGDRTVTSFQNFVKDGWKSVTGEVPGQKNVLKDYLVETIRTVESVLRLNIYVVIGACVLVGLFLGLLIVVLTTPKTIPPTTQQAATEPVEEDDHTKKD